MSIASLSGLGLATYELEAWDESGEGFSLSGDMNSENKRLPAHPSPFPVVSSAGIQRKAV